MPSGFGVGGPTLWNVVFDQLLEALGRFEDVCPIAYTDDPTKVIKGQNRKEIETRAQRAMDLAYRWCAENKMRTSPEKTCCLVENGPFRDNLPEIKSEVGGLLQFVEVSKYLATFVDGGE